jgi:hypothetical protein
MKCYFRVDEEWQEGGCNQISFSTPKSEGGYESIELSKYEVNVYYSGMTFTGYCLENNKPGVDGKYNYKLLSIDVVFNKKDRRK